MQEAIDLLDEHDGCLSAAAEAGGIHRNTFRNRVLAARQHGIQPNDGRTDALPSPKGGEVREHSGARIYVVTAAQNATGVHAGFMKALKRYCEHRGATLLAIPFRYRNPTSVWTANQETDEWWHKEISDHLIAEDVELNDNLLLAAGMKIQPTARHPLSGMQTYSGGQSAIFGHSKIELETVATPQYSHPKILTTTGCCTVENYTDTKAGALGIHHHIIGATVVEVQDGDRFHLRQISADNDGSFYDLDTLYTQRKVKPRQRAEALTCGDIHWQQMDPAIEEATFGEGGLVDVMQPKRLVVHDLLDFKSQNHHDLANFFERWRKHHIGITSVYEEVAGTLEWAHRRAEQVGEVAVVESNHNEAFLRWLNEGRGDREPENAWFYYNTWAGILPHPKSETSEIGHPLEYWHRRWFGDDGVRFLRRDDSYTVGGIEHAMHGDVGSNGAKGSVRSFSRIGVRSTVGHSHGPAIHGGVYQVGVCAEQMRYNERGPSNWLPAHCVQYPNGKRSLVVVVDGTWRLEPQEQEAA
jgi:hypothetical protein